MVPPRVGRAEKAMGLAKAEERLPSPKVVAPKCSVPDLCERCRVSRLIGADQRRNLKGQDMKTAFRNRMTATALVVAALAPCGAAMANFNYTDFSSVSGLSLVGNARQDSNRLLLTETARSNAGAAWVTAKQDVAVNFDTTIKVRMENRRGGGADGYALVIQNTGTSALGGSGGGIGYATNPAFGFAGIPKSLAIEIDNWDNAVSWSDLPAPHISIHSLGAAQNSPVQSASLGAAPIGSALAVDTSYTMRVTYTSGIMSVFWNGASTPLLTANVDLVSLLGLDSSGQAWVGVTASTGGAVDAQTHLVESFSFTGTPIPAPGSVALVASAGLLIARRRRK